MAAILRLRRLHCLHMDLRRRRLCRRPPRPLLRHDGQMAGNHSKLNGEYTTHHAHSFEKQAK